MRYIALLAVVFLSGCAVFSKAETDFSCPATGFVPGASVAAFPVSGVPEEVAVSAMIDGFTGGCSFKDKKAVDVELTLPFVARRSEAAGSLKEQQLSYFIAVLSPDEEVLQRQAFSTKVDFDNTGIGSVTEEHTIKIPLPAQKDAFKYKVAIGFALTPEQLEQNKVNK